LHAFEAGVRSWARVRLLPRRATPEDGAERLERAAGLTVRQLAASLRAEVAGASTAQVATPDDDAIDGEPAVRFRIAGPPRGGGGRGGAPARGPPAGGGARSSPCGKRPR